MKHILRVMILFFIISFAVSCGINNDEVNRASNLENEETENLNGEVQEEQEEIDDSNVADESESKEENNKQVKQKDSNKKLSEMQVHFIDVGQADAALIQYDDMTILIDSGDWNRNETVNYLHQLGIKKLDLMVGSHPHADHIGQMDKIMSEFTVDEVWMSGGIANSQVFQRVLTAIEQHDIGYDEPRAGDTFQIGNLKIDILSPTSITDNLNDDSIVMRLTYGKISFLFTGDAETPAENKMVSSGQNLSSTILKVGHHGSGTSSTSAFVDKVDPEVAIISVANQSKYNHPNKSVVDRFNKRKIDLLATKSHGTIVVSTDGISYEISTQKSGTVTAGDTGKSSDKKSVTSSDNSSTNKLESSKSKSSSKSKQENRPKNNKCIDINIASESELQGIKHIGEERSRMVMELRPFESIDELIRVKGIAEGRLNDIKAEGKACVN